MSLRRKKQPGLTGSSLHPSSSLFMKTGFSPCHRIGAARQLCSSSLLFSPCGPRERYLRFTGTPSLLLRVSTHAEKGDFCEGPFCFLPCLPSSCKELPLSVLLSCFSAAFLGTPHLRVLRLTLVQMEFTPISSRCK